MSKNQKTALKNDPLEAIFALNLGDFLTEHLISDDLLKKINTSLNDRVDRLKKQLKELISIYSLDKTLILLGFNSKDDYVIYNSIAKTFTQMLEVDACHVYLSHEYAKDFHSSANSGLILTGTSLETSNEIVSKNIIDSLEEEVSIIANCFKSKKTVYLKNAKKSKRWNPKECLQEDKVVTFLAVPLANNYENIGVLCLENYTQKEISPESIKLLQVTSRLFVTSMNLQKLIEEAEILIHDENSVQTDLQRLRAELTASIGDLGDEQQMFVEALAESVDAKSQFTREHSKNVANLAKEIAEKLKLNEKTIDLIYYAGLLQNIGKITLPEEIFSKKEKLSNEDWNKLQSHPNVGVNLLMKINFLSEVIPYINYHKERWDGQGEPEGLAGMSIPLGSRIIAVADAYQAMISERSYRKSLSNHEVLEIMQKEAGIKWDPVVVEALVSIKK